jgi:SAM-dependent methyltransferase
MDAAASSEVQPSGKIRLLAEEDFASPSLGTVWELCLLAEYDRERLVQGLAEWLGPPNGSKILDCSCGSGFPALDLHRLGYDLTCTDGSPLMLERFSRNARTAGVTLTPAQAYWEDLDKLYPSSFDLVFCRGCSLIYAGTWDSDSEPDRSALERSVQSFVRCLRPGGSLYVDTTQEQDLDDGGSDWTTHQPRMIDGHRIVLRERVTTDRKRAVRHWEVELQVDEAHFEFERKSHHVPHFEFVAMLKDAGLKDVGRTAVSGERYAVFVGRNPE